jgi:hypothetical protein
MKNLPDKYKKKIETIKNIILTTSGLLSEYHKSIDLTLESVAYDIKTDTVYEIVLELKLTDVYCPECDFEPSVVSDTINQIISKIRKGCNFGLTSDLQFKNSFNTTRGVLLYETKLWRDNFEYLIFGIFLDPGSEY